MSGTPYRDDQRLALAVTRFIEDVHQRCPHARLEPLTPWYFPRLRTRTRRTWSGLVVRASGRHSITQAGRLHHHMGASA
jgi:hypothetical protein